jgi:signal peptidase II
MIRKSRKNYLWLIFVLSIFIFDRISKISILKLFNNPNYIDQSNIEINFFLNLNLIWNDGIAFGLFSSGNNVYYNLISFIIILIILTLFYIANKSFHYEKAAYVMILGGALGNLFDRLYYSAVIDFIDINYKGHHWFIFNFADVFISFGVIALIIIEIFKKKI